MNSPFVMFDRDGTLIEHVHHLVNPNLVRLKPGVVSALMKLHQSGFKFGIISNQSVIARGLATLDEVNQINKLIISALEPWGIFFEFIYICPHLPSEGCLCRKPAIALGLRAIREHQIVPNSSYMVGDRESDMEFAKELGFSAIQLKSDTEKCHLSDYYSDTLDDAANWILTRINRKDR